MKIYHIGCTHQVHDKLSIPEDTDILIHTGDWSNSRDINENCKEFFKFRAWVENNLGHIPHKIFVPGNHSIYEYNNQRTAKEIFKEVGVHLLVDEAIEIEGIKFYGSPYVPRHGDWAYMAERHKLSKRWENIPEDTDILITHGPPKGILDLTEEYDHTLSQQGDKALKTFIKKRLKKLKLHMFSHIHSNSVITNNGVLFRDGVFYSNASVVKDGQRYIKSYDGNEFIIEKDENNEISILPR